jgi:hypothetical protein
MIDGSKYHRNTQFTDFILLCDLGGDSKKRVNNNEKWRLSQYLRELID